MSAAKKPLGNLGVDDWKEVFQRLSAPAAGTTGLPGDKVKDVVPGAFPEWQYYALAMLSLLDENSSLKDEMRKLKERVEELEARR